MCKSCRTADFGQTFAWKALPLLGQRAPEVRLADQRGPGRERAKNVVFGWPVVQMMWMSFHNWSIIEPPKWVGVANFVRAWNDRQFWTSLPGLPPGPRQ